jgi:hypothetical protein
MDWPEPLVIEHKVPNKALVVWSMAEASNCLTGDWPTKDGVRYHEAMRTMMRVLDGKGEPSEAREAFKSAAVEAGYFVHD